MSAGADQSNAETGPWNPSWIVAFPAGVVVSQRSDGSFVLDGNGVQFRLRRIEPGLGELLSRLEPPGVAIRELVHGAIESTVSYAVSRVFHHLAAFLAEGFLTVSAVGGGNAAATLTVVASGFRLTPRPAGAVQQVLSRFAYLRRGAEGLVAESPRSSGLVTLRSPQAALCVQSLAAPQSVDDLVDAAGGMSRDAVGALIDLLHAADLLTVTDAAGSPAEDEDTDLLCWEFHDLLFHARSRRVRFDEPYGAAFAVAGRMTPPPAVKTPRAEVIAFARPDLEAIERRDPALTGALERRQSVREFGDVPLSLDKLGEFLYRVARVRDWRSLDVETESGAISLELTSRPYPSGGSLYELEIYPVIQSCRGVDPGLYRYDPAVHGLESVCPASGATQALLHDAGYSAGIASDRIQVLLVVAARFPRIAWKYSAFAYALVLKHVGVLFQTMYLVATAMNLAPCALGAGNADRFSKLVSDSMYAETSVGEFLLGSRA